MLSTCELAATATVCEHVSRGAPSQNCQMSNAQHGRHRSSMPPLKYLRRRHLQARAEPSQQRIRKKGWGHSGCNRQNMPSASDKPASRWTSSGSPSLDGLLQLLTPESRPVLRKGDLLWCTGTMQSVGPCHSAGGGGLRSRSAPSLPERSRSCAPVQLRVRRELALVVLKRPGDHAVAELLRINAEHVVVVKHHDPWIGVVPLHDVQPPRRIHVQQVKAALFRRARHLGTHSLHGELSNVILLLCMRITQGAELHVELLSVDFDALLLRTGYGPIECLLSRKSPRSQHCDRKGAIGPRAGLRPSPHKPNKQLPCLLEMARGGLVLHERVVCIDLDVLHGALHLL
mmetsp:Transcript_5516/g.16462  ORF Transcript_5516/g.16462 Transcript_5516/m.16462 type:complete len:344 (+) Transcript_5516:299-1330(+)